MQPSDVVLNHMAFLNTSIFVVAEPTSSTSYRHTVSCFFFLNEVEGISLKMATSSHLNWLIIRNNNSFLLKKRDLKKPFSTEPNNLTNVSSYRYSGIVHKKTLGVVPAEDKKGFTAVMKKGKYAQRPAKNVVRVTMKAGPRRSLKKLRNLLTGSKYRKDLTQAALRRASAVIRSQKPAKVKKTKKPE